DREGNAKVVDFGIAKGVRDASLTDAGTGMGTVHYVSPEQARGEPATPASDLYATGVVLFEMLTKRLPFEADTPIGVAMLHVNQPPPSPRQFNPAIPPQVEAIILRALAKDPSERFPSAGAFANALRHWDAPEPVRTETALLPATSAPPRREPAVAPHAPVGRQPTAPTRREQPAAPPHVPTRPPTVTGSGRGLPPRSSAPRDDLGCATWLVGAAILIAIVGLLLLAFRVLPGWLDEDGNGSAAVFEIPTPTTAPTATSAATATSELGAAVPTIGAVASPTARAGAPSPTPAVVLETVPDLIGGTMLDAESLLGGRWILVSEESYSDVYPAGVIIAQSPDAGVGLAAGESISVVVSLGPQYVVVPAVTWLTTDEAAAELVAAGFDYVVREEPSVDYPAGIAMWTEPLDVAPPGSTVTLVVSMGDVVLVPDVYGLDEFSATSELNAAGLLVGEIYYSGCDTIVGINPSFNCATFPDGGVAIMSATPHIYVERGASVDLVIYSADL
ncbi:MAG: serine/threonine-protein kinase, partial [Chloroflexi bacterium]